MSDEPVSDPAAGEETDVPPDYVTDPVDPDEETEDGEDDD
jgi:hypothetical protein